MKRMKYLMLCLHVVVKTLKLGDFTLLSYRVRQRAYFRNYRFPWEQSLSLPSSLQ